MKLLGILLLIIIGPIPFLYGVGKVSDDPTFHVTVIGTAIVMMVWGTVRVIRKHRERKRQRKFMDAVISRKEVAE